MVQTFTPVIFISDGGVISCDYFYMEAFLASNVHFMRYVGQHCRQKASIYLITELMFDCPLIAYRIPEHFASFCVLANNQA